MTVRELIQRLEEYENQDREIDFYVEQYNEDTEEFDRASIAFINEELEGDSVEIYFTQPLLD
tara:strand:- start:650 stop:835 length:186 start_codon:yes stop_codon:yes gene_type:complete